MIAGAQATRLRVLLVSGLLAIVSGAALSAQTTPQGSKGSEFDKVPAADSYGKLPINIEVKEGFTDKNVEFVPSGGSYGLHLTSEAAAQARNRAVFAVQPVALAQRSGHAHGQVVFSGDAAVATVGLTERGSYAAYQGDEDPLTNAVHHSAAADLIQYGNQDQRENGLAVTHSADLKQIQVQFSGITKVKLDAEGEMIVLAEDGDFAFTKAVNGPETERRRNWLAGNFTFGQRHKVNLSLSGDAPPRPLVTDPVVTYSTHFDGGESRADAALALD